MKVTKLPNIMSALIRQYKYKSLIIYVYILFQLELYISPIGNKPIITTTKCTIVFVPDVIKLNTVHLLCWIESHLNNFGQIFSFYSLKGHIKTKSTMNSYM